MYEVIGSLLKIDAEVEYYIKLERIEGFYATRGVLNLLCGESIVEVFLGDIDEDEAVKELADILIHREELAKENEVTLSAKAGEEVTIDLSDIDIQDEPEVMKKFRKKLRG